MVPAALVKPYWVISRALLHFVSLPLANVPPARLEGALRLQLLPLSPYPRFGFACRRGADSVSVYFWDQARLETALAREGLAPHDVIAVPEPLLREMPADGFSLLQGLEGMEGRCCREGEIRTSRWWPSLPGHAEWLAFVRDCGAPEGCPRPEPLVLSWLDRIPPQVLLQHRPFGGFAISEAFVLQGLTFVLGLGVALIGVRQYKIESALASRRAEVAALQPQVRHALDLRRQAEQDRARVEELIANEDNARQLNLMAQVVATGLGDKSGILLREWDYRNDRLRLVLASAKEGLPRAVLLERLAAIPGCGNARLLSDNDPRAIVVELEVTADQLQNFVPPREELPLLAGGAKGATALPPAPGGRQ